jgi:hypothetical protein
MNRIILPFLVVITLFSCKKEADEAKAPETVAEKPAIEECYKGIVKEDTIAMTLIIKDNEITDGQLSYHLFEKDRNDGTLKGQIKGDTIFADYTFMSEGKQSVREVAFLKQGNAYMEGYGDVREVNGKMIFVDPKKLKFDSKTVLLKSECHK